MGGIVPPAELSPEAVGPSAARIRRISGASPTTPRRRSSLSPYDLPRPGNMTERRPPCRQKTIRPEDRAGPEGPDRLPGVLLPTVLPGAKNFSYPRARYRTSRTVIASAEARNGWLDGEAAMQEALTSIKRVGADMILTYYAREFVEKVGSGV